MNINATLFGQMLTFALFVGVTMRYIWPPILDAMDERQAKIKAGLESASQGVIMLEKAEKEGGEIVDKAKGQASQIVVEANKRSQQIMQQGQAEAKVERERILNQAKQDAEQQIQVMKDELVKDMSALISQGAAKVLGKELGKKHHDDLVADLIKGEA